MTSRTISFTVILFIVLLTWYTKTEILTEREIVNFYSTQLSYEQIEQMLINQRKWEWLGYLLIPVVYLLKLSLVTLCIYTGVLLLNIKSLKWSKYFGEVMTTTPIPQAEHNLKIYPTPLLVEWDSLVLLLTCDFAGRNI